jgi:hypothetical protein
MSPEEQKREHRLKLLDDHIGQSLRDSEASGELRAAPSYGRPLHFGDGYAETPDALKMPMKILKDAGYAPPEVELMREIAALQATLAASPDMDSMKAQQQRLADMRQQLALRLEKLRSSGSL